MGEHAKLHANSNPKIKIWAKVTWYNWTLSIYHTLKNDFIKRKIPIALEIVSWNILYWNVIYINNAFFSIQMQLQWQFFLLLYLHWFPFLPSCRCDNCLCMAVKCEKMCFPLILLHPPSAYYNKQWAESKDSKDTRSSGIASHCARF